jgi:hypothetical protein
MDWHSSVRRAALLGFCVAACGTQRAGSPEASQPPCPDCPTSSTDDEAPGATRLLPLLCPACVPEAQSGTETSDFNDDPKIELPPISLLACGGVAAAWPAGAREAFHLDELRRDYEAPIDVPILWRFYENEHGSSSADVPVGTPTRLLGAMRLGEAQYLAPAFEPAFDFDYHMEQEVRRGEPARTREEVLSWCPAQVDLPVSIAFEAADGTLLVELEQRLTFPAGSRPGTLWGSVDLARARGTLDLQLDPELHHQGRVDFDLNAFARGRRVRLMVSARSWATTDPATGLPEGAPAIQKTFTAEIDDHCDLRSFPVDAAQPLPELAGRSPVQLLDEWRATVASTPPPRAIWRDGGGASIDVAVGAPTSVCLYPERPISIEPGWSAPEITFESDTRVTSSDRRIDSRLPFGRAQDAALSLGNQAAALPAEEFAALSGVQGVSPGGNSWLSVAIQARFERRNDGVEASGSLEVEGDHCSLSVPSPEDCAYLNPACLYWPDTAELPSTCGIGRDP